MGRQKSFVASDLLRVTVGRWLAGPSFNQGVGGSIPVLADVSLSKLSVAVPTVYESNMIVSRQLIVI